MTRGDTVTTRRLGSEPGDPVGPAVRWGLDPARLASPVPGRTDVSRVSVLARLSGPDARLVSVVAPMGYGKTKAVAEFARQSGRHIAWLSVGDDCRDHTTLARYLAVALDPYLEGVWLLARAAMSPDGLDAMAADVEAGSAALPPGDQ